MRLGASRIKTYLTCHRQFRYTYVDKIPAVPTGPLTFGTVLHESIKLLWLRRVESVSR